jgi:glyoxylase-like metal-dependent hydrolase (beta-lactamase superfamily II)/rhodanese-related sulfurtransferase
MIFRQLFDRESCTYTYLLGDEGTRKAVLIDPVRELVDRDIQVLVELNLTLTYTLETHVHADHITGAGLLRSRLGSESVLSARGGADCVDHQVDHGDVLQVGDVELQVIATPGHTNTCMSYYVPEQEMVFTGDTLFIRGCGRTDFQEGSSEDLFNSVHERLFSLPASTRVFPGHDYKGRTMSTIAEEKQHNPRLGGGRSLAQFVVIMEGLNLSLPKKLAVAVPANQNCGMPVTDAVSGWAPIVRSSEGVPEVSVGWLVEQDRTALRIIDVRDVDEFVGELGHIEEAEQVALASLVQTATPWDREATLITVCKTGFRSGNAAQELESMGFMRVASMAGGMQSWNDSSLPIRR